MSNWSSSALPNLKNSAKRSTFTLAPEVIGMDEHPLHGPPKEKGSVSLRRNAPAERRQNQRIGLGWKYRARSSHRAKMILSTLPRILRPLLLALMPTKKNPVAVLDVGANVQVKAAHLVQFAMMGSAYQKTRGIENPTVGILNIGSEE